MENEELNKKLAEFWGFKYDTWLGWIYPDGENFDILPNFTESLDAIFKWLVPKLDTFYEIQIFCDVKVSRYYCQLKRSGKIVGYSHWVETPALALCKAIEQLIDKEK